MSINQLAEKKRWTYQDYLKLDDGLRYEIIGGNLIMTPAPESNHQRISRNLEFLIWQYVKSEDLGEVFDAPIDVILDDEETVQPDIVFISKENLEIIKRRGIFGSPDLVVEILSPSSIRYDRKTKKELYAQYHIKEYWIVDVANQAIEVYILENDNYQLKFIGVGDETVTSIIIEGLEIKVSDVITHSYAIE